MTAITSHRRRMLTKQADALLRAAGFEDAEVTTSNGERILRRPTPEHGRRRKMHEDAEYYAVCREFLHSHDWSTAASKYARQVWELHSDGHTRQEIMRLTGAYRRSVDMQIAAFEQIMCATLRNRQLDEWCHAMPRVS